MPSHQLTLDKGRSSDTWLLSWDSATLSLTGPSGELIFERPADRAHRIIQLYELYEEGKVSFATSIGPLTFKRNRAAAQDVRELVLAGLRADPEYRELQKQRARIIIPLGLVAFFIGGGLFALYCWWASWAADPPQGHWLYSIGWLIHLVLLVLLGLALGGLYGSYLTWQQLRRVRRVERELGENPADKTA